MWQTVQPLGFGEATARAARSDLPASTFASTFSRGEPVSRLVFVARRCHALSYSGRPRAAHGYHTGNSRKVWGCTQRAVRAIIATISGISATSSSLPSGISLCALRGIFGLILDQ